MSLLKNRRQQRLTRREALAGVPVVNPWVRRKNLPDGGASMTVTLERGRGFFERMRPAVSTREYELDSFGVFVMDLVDNERSVSAIIDAFEERFALSRRECELSVVAFVKLLMQRHVLSVAVARSETAAGSRPAATAIVLAGGLLLGQAWPAMGATNATAETATLDALRRFSADYGGRAPGTAGNLALEEHVIKTFEASGFESGTIRFRAPVLRPGTLTLEVDDAPPFRLDAMHPTLMRPGNFATNRFDTRLVYLGTGDTASLEAVRGVDLDGALAVMDYSCDDAWMELLRFGISGVIFIGDGSYPYRQTVTKLYTSEVPTPRFFVDGAVGQRLRTLCTTSRVVKARATATPSYWELTTLRNGWVLIPGTDAVRAEKLVVLTAAIDANSVVPARAFGAERSINLHLLLKLLEDFKAEPPKHSVMLVALNAHTQRFAGDRLLAWHLLGDETRIEGRRDDIAAEMRLARLYTTEYGQLQLRPVPEEEKADLHVMMEILWKLLAAQEAEADQASGGEGQSADGGCMRRFSQEEAAGEAGTEPEKKLDLSAVDTNDVQSAIATARQAIVDEYSGFFATRGMDQEEMDRQREADLAVLDRLADMSVDAFLAKARRIEHVFEDERLFEAWRSKLDETTGRRVYVKGKLQDEFKSRLNRATQGMMLLSSTERSDLSVASRTNRLAELTEYRDHLRKLLVLFNKIDIGVGRSRTRYREIAIDDTKRDMLREAAERFVSKYAGWHERFTAALDMDVANGVIRRAIGTRQPALVVALDLSGRVLRYGFSNSTGESRAVGPTGFGDICVTLATEHAPEEGHSTTSAPLPYVDAISGACELSPAHFFGAPESGIGYYHAADRTPALALKSVFTDKGHAFGPDDTVDRLDAGRVERLQASVRTFLARLLANDEAFSTENLDMEIRKGLYLWSLLARTYSLEQFTGKPIPTTDIPGCLVTIYDRTRGNPPQIAPPVVDGDVLNCFMGISDETANAYFIGLGERSKLATLGYKLDSDHKDVVYALDMGRVQSSKQINSNVQRAERITLPMFASREFFIKDRIDPTRLSTRPVTVDSYWPKAARGQSDPDRYGLHGADCLSPVWAHLSTGPASVYLYRKEKGFIQDALMVITADKRCVLGATEENPEGEGFASQAELGPEFFRHAARDMAMLNVSRNAEMKGVVNQLVDDFLAEGERLNRAAERALDANDHRAYVKLNYEALGSEVQAHSELRSMNADMLKAIIVYMAMMLPFCFFLEKLLFNFKRMEHALGGFVVLFVCMYTLFRFIHPAFRIAMSPEAIFIAFVLGAIGCFTASVLNARFSGEMQVLLRGMGGLGEQASYGTVGQTAMLIGVQNMRRRRVRTTLTTATIVLVVFTMLAFSSVSRKATPTLIKKAGAAIYTGFFFHWPGGAAMDEASVDVFRNLFADRAEVTTRRLLEAEDAYRLERVAEPDVAIDIAAISGLEPDDRALQGSMALIEGEPFSSPAASEILLPIAAADALGIGSRDVGVAKVRLLGRELLVRGLIHDERYRAARDLNPNLPLVPMKRDQQKARNKAADEEEDLAPFELSKLMLETARLAIVPVELAAELGAKPRSVSVAFKPGSEDTKLGEEVTRLLTVSQAKFFVGSRNPFALSGASSSSIDPGVYYVGSSYRTAIGGLAKLIIPLIIAGSIILNTMLGTVYERKSEIAVFNAIGLNPTHIFLFFLAEAAVYSFIGSVGGYLIGQVLTVSLKAAGLVQDVNINFSSLMVVYAILFTMGLVILSTLYPGYVATRTAVPSGQRKWSIPEHDGNTMVVIFPFIYRPRLAFGAMAYLYDYFEPLSEQSLGDIIATLEKQAVSHDDAGRPVLQLAYSIALAPYDLGVTQMVTFAMRYDEVVSSYRMHMTIERVSGRDTNWVTTNKPFLTRMRKYLLRWRNIDPTQQKWFVDRATDLFDVETLKS